MHLKNWCSKKDLEKNLLLDGRGRQIKKSLMAYIKPGDANMRGNGALPDGISNNDGCKLQRRDFIYIFKNDCIILYLYKYKLWH